MSATRLGTSYDADTDIPLDYDRCYDCVRRRDEHLPSDNHEFRLAVELPLDVFLELKEAAPHVKVYGR